MKLEIVLFVYLLFSLYFIINILSLQSYFSSFCLTLTPSTRWRNTWGKSLSVTATLPTTLYMRTWWRISLSKKMRTKMASFPPESSLTNMMNFKVSSGPRHSLMQSSSLFISSWLKYFWCRVYYCRVSQVTWKYFSFTDSIVVVWSVTCKLFLCEDLCGGFEPMGFLIWLFVQEPRKPPVAHLHLRKLDQGKMTQCHSAYKNIQKTVSFPCVQFSVTEYLW